MNDFPLLKVGILFLVLATAGLFLWGAVSDGFPNIFGMSFFNDGKTADAFQDVRMDKLRVNGHVLSVEIADTPEKSQRGLSGRESMGTDEGMLFLFNDTRAHIFWMNEMLFPLDIIWIRDGIVVDVVENAPAPENGEPPTTFIPGATANAVLELNAGKAKELGIKKGTEVEYPFP